MSYVVTAPEMMAAAAGDLANIGSKLSAANAAAAASTTAVMAAAGDEVSAAIAALFSAHSEGFQALSARAAAFHAQFVQTLTAGARSYVSAEAANVAAFMANSAHTVEQDLLNAINRPFQQIPTTLATGFTQVGNTLITEIFGAPANPPFPATQPGTFTGTLSLLTRLEDALLLPPLKAFLNLPVIDNQLVTPNSPLLALFNSDIPPLSLLAGNSPPKFLPLLLGETVQHTTFDGMSVVQITPAHPDGNYVVAMHGGLFVLPPLIFHWLDYTVMAHQTGATIEVPIYPMLPQGGTAGTVVPEMAGLISTEIAQHGAPHVSVIGDSAGGNIALAAVEYLVANHETVPASMVLLSPWLEVGNTNPNIALVHDPWLPPIGTGQQIGKEWAGNLPENNYEVSPLYGSLKGLPPTYVYSGSLDPVAPDVLVLQQEAASQGAPISFVLANGGIHDSILITPDGFQYWPQIDQELGA